MLSLKRRPGRSRSSCWCFWPHHSSLHPPQDSKLILLAPRACSRYEGALQRLQQLGRQRGKWCRGGDWEQTEVSWRLQPGLLRRQVDIRHHTQLPLLNIQSLLYNLSAAPFLGSCSFSQIHPVNHQHHPFQDFCNQPQTFKIEADRHTELVVCMICTLGLPQSSLVERSRIMF